MKRYLVIKIGASQIMAMVINKTLTELVYVNDDQDTIPTVNMGTMLMFNFLSEASIDDISKLLGETGISNFVITEVTQDTMRASLSDTVNQAVNLNMFKPKSEKTLDDMNISELNEELNIAIEQQLFERCGEIKKALEKQTNEK